MKIIIVIIFCWLSIGTLFLYQDLRAEGKTERECLIHKSYRFATTEFGRDCAWLVGRLENEGYRWKGYFHDWWNDYGTVFLERP